MDRRPAARRRRRRSAATRPGSPAATTRRPARSRSPTTPTTFVVLHEAAHAWFDGSLLADRWASEGFASYYALRAAKAIGEKKVTGDVADPGAREGPRPAQRLGPPPGERPTPTSRTPSTPRPSKLATLIARAGRARRPDARSGRRSTSSGRAYQPTGARASLETSDGGARTGAACSTCSRTGPASDLRRPVAALGRPPGRGEPLLDDRAAARDALRRRSPASRRRGCCRGSSATRCAPGSSTRRPSCSTARRPRSTIATRSTRPRGAGLTAAADDARPRSRARAASPRRRPRPTPSWRRSPPTARPPRRRPTEPGPRSTAIGLWNADPTAALEQARSTLHGGDLRTTVEAAACARRRGRRPRDVGRNRVLAVGGVAGGACSSRSWLLLARVRDRRAPPPAPPLMAHRG